jgi:hypothetical protein
MYTLRHGRYEEIERSGILPPITAKAASDFLEANMRMTNPAWMKHVRQWVRENRKTDTE